MAKHRKHELLNTIVQSVVDSGWNVIYAESISEHPFVLDIYRGEERYRVRIYVWDITPGGKNRPLDEYRIQITSVRKFVRKDGEKTLILGWWKEGQVFAGWDFNEYKHKAYRPRASDSAQIKEENLRKAIVNGFSPYRAKTGGIAVAFRPDFFVNYLQSLENIHSLEESIRDFRVLEKIAEKPLELNTSLIEQATKKRQSALVLLTKRLRDASFKARVLNAYGNRCAFSGLQLKLVDAAHILPVSDSSSTDLTSNGIALSALHHRAYDAGLITFDDKYRILTNTSRLNDLKKIGFDGGMKEFIEGLRPIIVLPPSISDRPNINYVKKANRLRGWK